MGVEQPVEAMSDGKRTVKRARVLLAAKLKTSMGEIEVRLRDLSRKGALVESGTIPPVGSEVVFLRGSTIVPARVAWTGGNRVGLEFMYMIDESEVLVQLGRGPANQNQQRFRRPRILGEDMSDHERKLAQRFARSVGIDV